MSDFLRGFCFGWAAAWVIRAMWLRWERYDAVLAAQASMGTAARREVKR